MIRSMTAFGRAETDSAQQNACWEIRSVNQRYLEVTFRMPESCRHLEGTLREQLRKQLQRGKVECTLRLGERSITAGATLDAEALANLQATLRHLQSAWPELAAPPALDVLRWPGILRDNHAGDDEEARTAAISAAFADALRAHVAQREQEGGALASLVLDRLQAMDALLVTVKAGLPAIQALQRQRLLDRFAEAKLQVDDERLEQELLFLAQKMDVAEELDRLQTHMAEIRRTLAAGLPCGRRLDFLTQELNREANTLSSKSADSSTTQAAVELKVLIEQIREQVQNIE